MKNTTDLPRTTKNANDFACFNTLRKNHEENFSLDGVKREKFSRRGLKTRLEPYFPWLRLIRFERSTSAFANSSAVVIPMAFNSRR